MNEQDKDNLTKFEVTKEHLKLLRRTYVSWWNCEFGAPCINPKRPYGNSYVEGDIIEILGISCETDEDGDYIHTDEQLAYASKIHSETDIALQICLSFGEFKEGHFWRKFSWDDWQKAEQLKQRDK